MMLYLVGIICRDGRTESDKEISSRLWMLLAKLVIIFLLFKVIIVVHGIFLLDFSFKVCDFLVQIFQLEAI